MKIIVDSAGMTDNDVDGDARFVDDAGADGNGLCLQAAGRAETTLARSGMASNKESSMS
jgi:hypothetical protein